MGKVTDFLDRLKKVKHIEIIACGVLLIIVLSVYFSCASCSGSTKTSTTMSEKDISNADYCTAMQIQLEKIISEISGVGSASVAINWDKSVVTSYSNMGAENPKATGVLIVCEGGDSTKVKLDVIYAVSTLLNLSIENIIVYPKS